MRRGGSSSNTWAGGCKAAGPFAGTPAPTQACAIPVGAGLPAKGPAQPPTWTGLIPSSVFARAHRYRLFRTIPRGSVSDVI
ncbi:hypothetical protein DMX12_12420 [Pseudomonas sp. MB-090624]|nr:hypothetical protein DMX12_12420 [Pseudomonas sp. MB-090624]